MSENKAKGCVRAKFDLGSTPSGPHLAALSFSCEGTTFSGVGLELLGSGYRTSLVKKRIVSGGFDSPVNVQFCLADNLYCVGGDVKSCSIQSNRTILVC